MTWLTRIAPRRKPPRRGPPRSKAYLAFIHRFACLVCGLVLVEAAHTYGFLRGGSQKSSDFSVLPLCREHHRVSNYSLDKLGRLRFQALYGLDLRTRILEFHEQFEQQGGVVEVHKDDWWRLAA